jgi:signal transduction histidine kinase
VIRFGSVLSRIVALHVAAIIVTSICIPLALFLTLRTAAETLHHQALRDQIAQIVHYLAKDPDGSLRLSLPSNLAEFYSQAYGRAAFAVLGADGRVLFSSLPGKRAITQLRPNGETIEFFQQDHSGVLAPARSDGYPIEFFSETGRGGSALYGAAEAVEFGGQRIAVQVVEDILHRDVLIDDIVDRFLSRVGWITIPVLLLLLGIDVLIFRGAMQPIVVASNRAAQIGPANTELRLPEAGLPTEVLPLVRAINRALDRLDAGFRGQREFTADAAHELRTPLAILSMQIDTIDDRELAQALRSDVDGMTRLVNQLLEFAELETLVVGENERVELGAVAAEAVAAIAPVALAQSRTVALLDADRPVWVRGERDTLGRALRNLIENALAHTASGTTVEIAVDPAGAALHVMDRGPGVPPDERERIFQRFWRRDRRRPGHAGLGLAIVARIAEMHGASVAATDRPGGGAIFSLRFPTVPAPNDATAQLEEAAA